MNFWRKLGFANSPFSHPLGVSGEKDSLKSSFLSLWISCVLIPFPCANCPFGNDCLLGDNLGSPSIDQCHCWSHWVPIKAIDIFKYLTSSLCLYQAPMAIGVIVKVNDISPSSIGFSISAILNKRHPILPYSPYVAISSLWRIRAAQSLEIGMVQHGLDYRSNLNVHSFKMTWQSVYKMSCRLKGVKTCLHILVIHWLFLELGNLCDQNERTAETWVIKAAIRNPA